MHAGVAAKPAEGDPLTAIRVRLTHAHAQVRDIDRMVTRLRRLGMLLRVLNILIVATLLTVAWRLVAG